MLKSPAEELKRIETARDETKELRDRWESDFGLFRNELFTMPKKEGSWDSWTSNRPSTTAYRIINTLAASRLKLWIPLSEEDETQRRKLSKTEAFPYGVFALRDSIISTIPGAMTIHDAMSFFASIRGWLALLCYFQNDHRKIKTHIQVWDPLNSFWISGADGLLWAGHQRWANPDEVRTTYGSKATTKDKGEVLVTDVYDRDEQGVIIEGSSVGEGDMVSKIKHGLDHVPVLIKAGGAMPLIQSTQYRDAIKNLGESWAVNNRHIYELENRMGSYSLTMAGRTAKTPQVGKYDSTKGGKPPEFEGSPFEKGTLIPLDVGKGESIESLTPPEATRDFYAFFDYLKTSLDVGDMAPVSFSQLFQPQTAAGMNLLRKLSELNILAPKRLMESAYVWLAHELVGQYKSGPFKKLEIQGMDGLERRFKFEVKPADMNDQWNFEAQLLADFPADEMANTGMAVQLKGARLMSDETIMDRLLHISDVDAEKLKLDKQSVFQIAQITMRKVAADLADPDRGNDPEGAQYILEAIESMKAETQPGIAPQTGIPSPVRPSASSSAVVPQPPGTSKRRNFLSRMGGGQ